jgi:hypothetical protein
MRRALSTAVCAAFLLTSASPARAQELPADFRADIEKLLTLTNAAGMGSDAAGTLAARVLTELQRRQPNIPPPAVAAAREVLEREFTTALSSPDGLRAGFINGYANHFTHDDVRELLRFYTSDVGRKLLTATPAIIQAGAAASQAWFLANGARIDKAVEARLRADGFLK